MSEDDLDSVIEQNNKDAEDETYVINDNKYWIYSIERNAWWKQSKNGYTFNIREAGRFSNKEAAEIILDANISSFEEIGFPVDKNVFNS